MSDQHDHRVRPVQQGAERQMLESMLDFFRSTVIAKANGLTDAEAATGAVPTTTLTVAGLVKHLTATERFWFSIDFAAHDVEWPWTDDDPHGAFTLSTGETIDDLIRRYTEECDRSRRAVAESDLDDMAAGQGMTFSLRYAYLHMIQETARHCGHLDLIREAIDGSVGQ